MRRVCLQEDLVIWGDSITEHVSGFTQGRKPCCKDVRRAFKETFNAAGLRPVTFGVSGDQTQHLAWRLREGGEWVSPPPRIGLLLIGTNDLGHVYVLSLIHI